MTAGKFSNPVLLNVGEGIDAGNASWTFGKDVPKTFDQHVQKSVPFYREGHDLILQISDYFITPQSLCYEIGCSTGALTRKLATRHAYGTRFVGIDVEPRMIEQAKLYLADEMPEREGVSFQVDDAQLHPYEKSDFITAYYTIQFIAPRRRQDVFNALYESLNWGGALLLFEKVRGPDARFQDILNTLYTDYKLAQGYKPDEIIAKTRSLKGVLEPFSTQGNLDLLARAGFKDVTSIFKYLCFEGFLCIK